MDDEKLKAVSDMLRRDIGEDGFLDAVDIAAFFMSITRIVDADGHRNTMRASIMVSVMARVVSGYVYIRQYRWQLFVASLILMCLWCFVYLY